MVAVIVERTGTIPDVGSSELIEHLPQRTDSRQQVAEHAIEFLGVLKVARRMREPAQRLGCFTGIGAGIEGHDHRTLDREGRIFQLAELEVGDQPGQGAEQGEEDHEGLLAQYKG